MSAIAGSSSPPNPEPTDESLLARVARREVDALAALYDRHRSVAYGVALRVTGSVPAAEDVLQEAFLGVWRTAERFDPARGSGRGWLLAIVHNRAIDAVRRRRAVDPLPDADADPPSSLIGPDVWPEVLGRLEATAIRAALAMLPEPQREAIELAYWGGLTQTEIAERTGQPLGTVKGRMRLGLRALARSLSAGQGGVGGPTRSDVEPAPAGRSPSSPASEMSSRDATRGGAVSVLAALWTRLWTRLRSRRGATGGVAG